MATIYIDNKPYEVKDGQNLLQACLSLGFDIPYFCWHPAMHSVGACRQCAVKQFKDENDTQGRIVMACMTPAMDNTRISIDDEEARAFRSSVIEWLMTNHPHDCPICDEGGECHLQDMTVMTGHTYRRYRFRKRTYTNQDLGPFINHEMNRCIQCYRCVRFYRDYAGGRDFNVFAAHNRVYFGRHEDGVLENEFSGNLIEVCPTGVFTDKTSKPHYTRPWDLQRAPSICVHCGVGCNITTCERYGRLRRVRNRFNGEVNGYFLCDRGRFGYEFVNGERRIRRPLRRNAGPGSATPVTKAEALAYLGTVFSAATGTQQPIGPSRILGIGSPRASLESNFALRALVGPDRFCTGLAEADLKLLSAMVRTLRDGPARTPSLREVGEAEAVFVLGEDVTNVAPMIALRLRQAVRRSPMTIAEKLCIAEWDDSAVREALQDERGFLCSATVAPTKLDDIAAKSYCAAPQDLARLGFAVAHAIDSEAPSPADLPQELLDAARTIADTLKAAERPLIVSGPSSGSEAVIQAAANVAWALCKAARTAPPGRDQADRRPALCFTAPECNSLGLGLIGGRSLEAAFDAVANGEADTVVILENDLYRRADRAAVDAFFDKAKHVVVIDHILHDTAAKAEVVLPAAAFPEGDGSLVNNEGRAQRFVQVFVPEGDIQEAWRWLHEMRVAAAQVGPAESITLDNVVAAMTAALPALRDVAKAAPPAAARFFGLKIPRQTRRYSGRTAMRAHINVTEPKVPEDPDSPLAFSMEGYPGAVPGSLIPYFWAPGWNSIQSVNKFQEEVGGPLRGGDPGVRLIEASPAARCPYFGDVPAAFEPRGEERLVVPLYHIFGSEELSVLSPSMADRAPRPYLALSEADAAALNVAENDTVELQLPSAICRLPVNVVRGLPAGVVGRPVGVDGGAGAGRPDRGRIARGSPP